MHWVFLAVVLMLFVYHRTFRHAVSWSAVVSALVVGAVCVVASFSLSPRDDGLPQPMLVLGGGLVTGGVLALGGWGIWRVARQPGGGRRILRSVVGWLLLLGIVGVLGAGLGLVWLFLRQVVTLLAGNILAYTAAPHPALPTGFWDRAPRPTSGRLRRVLAQVHFQDLPELPQGLRKKQSPTAHLPTGVSGHRRQKKAIPMRYDKPLAA